MLAGIPVRDERACSSSPGCSGRAVRRRRRQAHSSAARRDEVLALTIADRESILRALDETPSDGLAELRGVLHART
jgi:hypothetical protein